MSTYVWCEDSGSGLQFWKEIFQCYRPDVIVETKSSNSRLRTAAGSIREDGNEYYILMDSFADNADVLREIDGLRRCITGKKNVHLVDIRSFEFALLSFDQLIKWVFAENDELKDKRSALIRARTLFVEQVTQSTDGQKKREFEMLFPYTLSHNNEQTAAELLRLLTRNTGFETDKRKLGECFIIDCCKWRARRTDDICGLDNEKLTADEKKHQLVNRSVLSAAFEKAGL